MRIRTPLSGAAAMAAIVVLAACSSSSPSASTTASTAPASTAESMAPSTAESMAPSATPVATVADDQLIFPGKLVVCIDIPYPPQEFFDAQGNPTGADPDISAELAKRLGLELQIENSVFDTIIAALTSGKCDLIISAQNLTKDRLGQVNMIPYFKAGQAFVVAKGNPDGITQPTDLCGKSVAAETGTTEVDYVMGTGDYEGAGLDKTCADQGLQAVDLQQFQKDTDALLALSSGQVAAYFADSPTAGYYTVQQPDQFELSGVTVEIANEGISVAKDRDGLASAVVTALKSMMDDGTYLNILSTYGLQDGAIDASEVQVVTSL